mgnify:CR=1 FL=1
MKRKGLDIIENLRQNYGITNTADLTIEQFNSIFRKINTMPDVKGE